MDLRNCVKCGRAFAYKGIDICNRCAHDDEADFKKVKEYLYDHPGATLQEVSEETEVSEKQILRYLRESRIEIREESNCLLHCERCEKSIRSGRFCNECVAEMRKEFSSVLKPQSEATPKEKPRTGTKMHIAGMRKKL
ncbi:TIGR03826 family flagellar region protein [Alkaliphilus hydrothermalis]|uniref:Flagellar operon protein (TIGR03826 family) n=1 Tax=Alkaliphilus hydrothermalis TaxID=1482730 RepID=A0ABS2NQX9_9FIRM|nr:flagellar operon protein (TIGR03826 family) [Alkaliphilus hydrothermalis]